MYDLSIEKKDTVWLITIRTIQERLWFINNKELEVYILAFLAKYQKKYEVELFSFCVMGNHYHLLAKFPQCNRAAFLRSFNSIFAKLVASHTKEFEGGKLWARRARVQCVPLKKDILRMFLYCALNPTTSGLVSNPFQYKGYNSFLDSINSKEREFTLFNKTEYYRKKYYNKNVEKENFIEKYKLKYTRLPGYEKLTTKDYKKELSREFKEKRGEILRQREQEGKKFPKLSEIYRTIVGSRPYKSKKSDLKSKRPLVLTTCLETKKWFLDWYFRIVESFKMASRKYREGFVDVIFPPGTYRPIFAN